MQFPLTAYRFENTHKANRMLKLTSQSLQLTDIQSPLFTFLVFSYWRWLDIRENLREFRQYRDML